MYKGLGLPIFFDSRGLKRLWFWQNANSNRDETQDAKYNQHGTHADHKSQKRSSKIFWRRPYKNMLLILQFY